MIYAGHQPSLIMAGEEPRSGDRFIASGVSPRYRKGFLSGALKGRQIVVAA